MTVSEIHVTEGGGQGEALLDVRDLKTHFLTRAGVARAVDGVSFSVTRGKVMGLVGESGSGKSVTGFSILGLVDPPGRIMSGSIRFLGEELVGANPRRLRELRGSRIAMIFQDPLTALDPTYTIGSQIAEAIRVHHKDMTKAEVNARVLELMHLVGLSLIHI